VTRQYGGSHGRDCQPVTSYNNTLELINVSGRISFIYLDKLIYLHVHNVN